MKPLPSIERARELLSYDPDTGVFTRIKGCQGAKMGGVAGCVNHDGYLRIMVDGVDCRAHRLAWFYIHGGWPKGHIDHINGNPADNRISNLRVVTGSQNSHNRTRAKGFSFNKIDKKFMAQIKIGGKSKHLGSYDNELDAHAAYLSAKREHMASQNLTFLSTT